MYRIFKKFINNVTLTHIQCLNEELNDQKFIVEKYINKLKNSETEVRKLEDEKNELIRRYEKLVHRNALLEDNNEAIKEIDSLTDKLETQYKQIFLIKQLEEKVTRKEDENKYLKSVIEELQALPNYKKFLNNVAEFKIPDAEGLMTQLKELNSNKDIISKLDTILHYLRGRCF